MSASRPTTPKKGASLAAAPAPATPAPGKSPKAAPATPAQSIGSVDPSLLKTPATPVQSGIEVDPSLLKTPETPVKPEAGANPNPPATPAQPAQNAAPIPPQTPATPKLAPQPHQTPASPQRETAISLALDARSTEVIQWDIDCQIETAGTNIPYHIGAEGESKGNVTAFIADLKTTETYIACDIARLHNRYFSSKKIDKYNITIRCHAATPVNEEKDERTDYIFNNKDHWEEFSRQIQQYPNVRMSDAGFIENCTAQFFQSMEIGSANRNQRTSFKSNIEHLKRAINEMKALGENLTPTKTQEVNQLAKQLNDKVDAFAMDYQRKPTTKKLQNFEADFNRVLHDKETQNLMAGHRRLWKPILANIAIAMTALGLFVIAAQLIYSKVKTGHSNFFFSKTSREKAIERIDHEAKILIASRRPS